MLPKEALVRRGDIRLYEDAVVFADSTFFDVFSFDLLHGPAPSREFAFLFTTGGASHHRALPGRAS